MVEQEPGTSGNGGLVSDGPKGGAGVRRAAILPDDGVVDGAAGHPIPDDRGLTLVGDADSSDLRGTRVRIGDDGAHGGNRCRPDLFGIVLDQARRRINLGKFLLRMRDRSQVGIEQDGARRRRALVDGN